MELDRTLEVYRRIKESMGHDDWGQGHRTIVALGDEIERLKAVIEQPKESEE